jgi:hypothetical protein
VKSSICWDITLYRQQVASIIRVEEKAEQETSVKADGKQILRMEAICSSETSVDFSGLHGPYNS